jgi:hypothetical protein
MSRIRLPWVAKRVGPAGRGVHRVGVQGFQSTLEDHVGGARLKGLVVGPAGIPYAAPPAAGLRGCGTSWAVCGSAGLLGARLFRHAGAL